ncbi:4798_t:CDS:2, partial [Racocetra fulgida]
MEKAELNALESYSTIENNNFCLNKGPAWAGCAITGTPSIGKSYFGLYLLFYIRFNYPEAIIIWQYDKKLCYQFSSDGNVQNRDIYQFDEILRNSNNFFLVDAQELISKRKAYMILLTSPKVERFNEAVKWPDQEEIITLWALQYKGKKNNEDKELTLELVGELLDKWEIDLGINNKDAKKRSSDAISEDYDNEEASGKRIDNKGVKKRKTKKNNVGDDESEEASGSNVGSGQRNLKRSSNVIDNESEDASKSEVVKKRKMRKTDAIVEDE